jgi:hypothetical protein
VLYEDLQLDIEGSMNKIFEFLGKQNKTSYQPSVKSKEGWKKRTPDNLNETLLNYDDILKYLDTSIIRFNKTKYNTNAINYKEIVNNSMYKLDAYSPLCWKSQLVSKYPLVFPRCLQQLTGNISKDYDNY